MLTATPSPGQNFAAFAAFALIAAAGQAASVAVLTAYRLAPGK